jgi:hypothetical protein
VKHLLCYHRPTERATATRLAAEMTGSAKNSEGHKRFVGRFQPSVTRLPGKPPVDYSKGGDDFRCPKNTVTTSSFGRQVLGWRHTVSAPKVKFAAGARFEKSESVGVGPSNFGQMSSMGKQLTSNRRANGACSFGTSSREGCLKLYAVYTCKKG